MRYRQYGSGFLSSHAKRIMNTIIVTGKNGQVGWELARTLSPLGRIVAVDVDEVDFTKPESIRSFVRSISDLRLIVNPAAYTNVDGAEDAPGPTKQINTDAPAVLAEESKRLGIPMIHYSTDYVFDGKKETPYLESDPTGPLGVYGRTKLDGELAVCSINPRHLVFRLCWVYGSRGKNFFLTMLRLARQGTIPNVVNDQFGAPTWSRMIAEATAVAAVKILDKTDFDRWGVFHLAAGGLTSWHEFASEIFRRANERFSLENAEPHGIPSAEYPTKAVRPRFSGLCTEKTSETFGIKLPDWREQLRLVQDDGRE